MTESDLLRVMHRHQLLCQAPPKKRTRRQTLAQELTAKLNQLESELGQPSLLAVLFRHLSRDIECRGGLTVTCKGRQLSELWDHYETIRAHLLSKQKSLARVAS